MSQIQMKERPLLFRMLTAIWAVDLMASVRFPLEIRWLTGILEIDRYGNPEKVHNGNNMFNVFNISSVLRNIIPTVNYYLENGIIKAGMTDDLKEFVGKIIRIVNGDDDEVYEHDNKYIGLCKDFLEESDPNEIPFVQVCQN